MSIYREQFFVDADNPITALAIPLWLFSQATSFSVWLDDKNVSREAFTDELVRVRSLT